MLEIENIVSPEEMYNNYNIDLAEVLRVKGQPNNTTVVQTYIADKQNLIFSYIAGHKFNGWGDIPFLLSVPEYYRAIKKAVQQQIAYEIESGVDLSKASRVYLDSDKIMTIEKGLLEEEMISREAKFTLLNCAGLLYSGQGRCYL